MIRSEIPFRPVQDTTSDYGVNKINEVFAPQFDYIISLSKWYEIEQWKFYIKFQFDHIDKKKYSPTDNKQIIEWDDGLMWLLHENYWPYVMQWSALGLFVYIASKHGRQFKMNKYIVFDLISNWFGWVGKKHDGSGRKPK